jgi:hypothetical protein
MCGEKKQSFVVVSDGPRLVMVFSSGELQGRGFKANYTFETGVYTMNSCLEFDIQFNNIQVV